MTDLISKLADALVELNNASPRLPRKEQIEEVLRASDYEAAMRTAIDKLMMDAFPMYVVSRGEPMHVKWSTQNDFTNWAPVTQEQLVQAADDICATEYLCGDGKHYSHMLHGKCFCGATEIGS